MEIFKVRICEGYNVVLVFQEIPQGVGQLQDVILFIRSNKLNFESEPDIQAPRIRIPRIDQTWGFLHTRQG